MNSANALVYVCSLCNERFAVAILDEPRMCPFCGRYLILKSHETDVENL